MIQNALFPLSAVSIRASDGRTADLKAIARTEDGHDYALKGYPDRPLEAASEFIGYRLAHVCGLAVPFSSVVLDTDRRSWFGSRFEGGARSFDDLAPQEQMAAISGCGDQMSASVALAFFCGDTDRRFGNFLARRNLDDAWAVMPFDFSRALLVGQFPDDPWPQPPTSNTQLVMGMLRHLGVWSGPFAVNAIMRISGVKAETLRAWLAEMPAEWVHAERLTLLASWWGSDLFRARLQSTLQLL